MSDKQVLDKVTELKQKYDETKKAIIKQKKEEGIKSEP